MCENVTLWVVAIKITVKLEKLPQSLNHALKVSVYNHIYA